MEDKTTNEQQRHESGFTAFLKAVFVHNIGYKIFAVLFGAFLWALTAALL